MQTPAHLLEQQHRASRCIRKTCIVSALCVVIEATYNKLLPVIISQSLGAVESYIGDVGAAIGALAGADRDAVLAAALHSDGVVPLLTSITRCEENI